MWPALGMILLVLDIKILTNSELFLLAGCLCLWSGVVDAFIDCNLVRQQDDILEVPSGMTFTVLLSSFSVGVFSSLKVLPSPTSLPS